MHQCTDSVLLVRPVSFGFNAETAVCNVFQSPPEGLNESEVASAALKEFERFATALSRHGIHVHVVADTPDPPKPDAVFPNNWLTMHHDGRVILYPMCAPNRRWERRRDIVESLRQFYNVSSILDLSHHELRGGFLEGTGSVVFDHKHRLAFACLSLRTDLKLLQRLGELLGYRPVTFHATDPSGREIYHTNVMMSVGDGYAAVCVESIADRNERATVVRELEATGKDILEISFAQTASFAGNMLELRNTEGNHIIALSTSALRSLAADQRRLLERHGELCPLDISTIERTGGGSVRCMIAEIFLPGKHV